MLSTHSPLELPRADVRSLADMIARSKLDQSTEGFVPFSDKWEAWCVNGCRLSHFEGDSPVYSVEEGTTGDTVFAGIADLLGAIPAQKCAIRLLKLAPAGLIQFHVDDYEKFADCDNAYLRKVHIPIVSNEFCRHFERRDDGTFNSYWMEPGQFWYLDGTRLHGACNFGQTDRWHLVVEVVTNPDLERLRSVATPTDSHLGLSNVDELIDHLTCAVAVTRH